MRPLKYAVVLFVALLTLVPLPVMPGLVMAGHGWEHAGNVAIPAFKQAPDPLTVILVNDLLDQPQAVSTPELLRTAQALQDWANADVAPVWGLPPVTVTLLPAGARHPAARPHQWLLHIMDVTDDQFAEGYHTVSIHGIPYGEVGVLPSSADQGWVDTASHELAELLIDPYVNRIAWDGKHAGYITEACDPVSAYAYPFGDRGYSYLVSDFVYPAEFGLLAAGPYDRLRVLAAPFTTGVGGYLPKFRIAFTTP